MGKASRIPGASDRLRKQQIQIKNLQAQNRNRNTPRAVATTEFAGISASGSTGGTGNFLSSDGGSVNGAFALGVPFDFSIDIDVDGIIDIGRSSSNSQFTSNIQLEDIQPNTFVLDTIAGAANDGQLLVLRTFAPSTPITISQATLANGGNIQTLSDDDVTMGDLQSMFFIFDEDLIVFSNTGGTWRQLTEPAGSGGAVSFPIDFPELEATVGSQSVPVDFSDTDRHSRIYTLTGDIIFTFPNPPTNETAYSDITLIQDGTGGHTVTLPAGVENKTAVESGISIAPNSISAITIKFQGGVFYAFLQSSSGTGGILEPIILTLNTITPQTLPTTSDVNWGLNPNHIVIDRDVEFSFINLPTSGDYQGEVVIIDIDAVGGFAAPIWPASVTNPPTIDTTALTRTVVMLITIDGGSTVTHATSVGSSSTGNVEFSDDIFRIFDNADSNKKLAFEVSGVTSGQTRTWTVADANGEVLISPSQLDWDLNTFDIFNIDSFDFMPTVGTLSSLNVGFSSLGSGGFRANVLDITGLYQITNENTLHFEYSGVSNAVRMIDTLVSIEETVGSTQYSISKFNGRTVINEPTSVEYEIGATLQWTQTDGLITFDSDKGIIANIDQLGFRNIGNIIQDDAGGLIFTTIPGDDFTWTNGTTPFAVLDIDGLFLNDLYVQYQRIATPTVPGLSTQGQIFFNTATNRLNFQRRNDGDTAFQVIDLEGGGGAAGALSGLTIDIAKDWSGFAITNMGGLEMTGDIDLNTFDMFDIDQLTFMSTVGTLGSLNVGFGALGSGGFRANVLNNGDFEITEENVLHFSFDGGSNAIIVTNSLFSVLETVGGTAFGIAKFNGRTVLNEPTQIDFEIAGIKQFEITDGFITFDGAKGILVNVDQIGFRNIGNIIQDDAGGMIFDTVPGDDFTFGDGTTPFAVLDIDGLFLNDLYVQYQHIVTPTTPGLITQGQVFFNSGTNRLNFQRRNDGDTAFVVIDLETGSQTPWTSNIDGDGFNLLDLGHIEFRITSGSVSSAIPSIIYTTTGTPNRIIINVPTGDATSFAINGTETFFIEDDSIRFRNTRAHKIEALGAIMQFTAENEGDDFEFINGETRTNPTIIVEGTPTRTTWFTETNDIGTVLLQLVQNNDTPAVFRTLSNIDTIAENTVSVDLVYTRISSSSQVVTSGSEDGLLQMGVVAGGTLGAGIDIEAVSGTIELDFFLNPTKQFVVETFTNAGRPSPGNQGRIIFNSNDGQLNIDDGTNWTLPDGTVT